MFVSFRVSRNTLVLSNTWVNNYCSFSVSSRPLFDKKMTDVKKSSSSDDNNKFILSCSAPVTMETVSAGPQGDSPIISPGSPLISAAGPPGSPLISIIKDEIISDNEEGEGDEDSSGQTTILVT